MLLNSSGQFCGQLVRALHPHDEGISGRQIMNIAFRCSDNGEIFRHQSFRFFPCRCPIIIRVIQRDTVCRKNRRMTLSVIDTFRGHKLSHDQVSTFIVEQTDTLMAVPVEQI